MLCKNCGENIPENMNSCPKCGTTFPTVEETTVAPRGFSAKKNIIIILIAALLVLGVGAAVIAFAVTHSPSYQVSHGLKLAERYLSEQNYQQAVIEFLNILEIEPMNVDAYLGLADAYIGLGDIDSAVAILQKGHDKTGDERIQGKLDELQNSGGTSDPGTPGGSETNDPVEEGIVSRKRTYNSDNLLIEEVVRDENGYETATAYGELYDPFNGEATEWGVIGIDKRLVTEDGKYINVYVFTDIGSAQYISEYTYDSDFNFLTDTSVHTWDDYMDGVLTRLEETETIVYSDYVYGPYGLVSYTYTTENTYSYNSDYNSTTTYFVTYSYSSDGKLMKIQTNRASGSISEIIEYESDGKSNTSTGYLSNGEIRSITTRKFEPEGGGTYTYIRYLSNEIAIDINKYDENGCQIYYASYSGEKLNKEYEHSYTLDSDGRIIKQISTYKEYQDGILKDGYPYTNESTYEYEFDGQGNVISQKNLNLDGSIIEYIVWEYFN